jgi:soluble lytic murein transglycosylase
MLLRKTIKRVHSCFIALALLLSLSYYPTIDSYAVDGKPAIKKASKSSKKTPSKKVKKAKPTSTLAKKQKSKKGSLRVKSHKAHRHLSVPARPPLVKLKHTEYDDVIDTIEKLGRKSDANVPEVALGLLAKYPWLPVGLIAPDVEKSMELDRYHRSIISWFRTNPPTTDYGKIMYINAKIHEGVAKLVEQKETLKQLWHQVSASPQFEHAFVDKYASILTTEDYARKLDYLQWQGNGRAAAALVRFVPLQYRQLYEARLAADKSPSFAMKTQAASKNPLIQGDLYIKHAYIKQLLANDHEQAAVELLLRIKPSAHHHKWWRLRHMGAREAIKKKKYALAYKLVSGHGLSQGADFADAEWLSGWLALRFLQQPQAALQHFQNLYDGTRTSTTRSKAAYWAAQACKALNHSQETQRWLEVAADYPSRFYGQLASYALGKNYTENEIFQAAERANGAAITASKKQQLDKLAALTIALSQQRNDRLREAVLKYISKMDLSVADFKYLSDHFLAKGQKVLSVILSRHTSNQGMAPIKSGYPILPIQNNRQDKALYLAIIRQESNFDQNAVSAAGAVGLMQLRPYIAGKIAEVLGLPKNAYANNAQANVAKGVYYVDHLASKYRSTILTIASYNAGEGNVNKWMKIYGDPRNLRNIDDIVDWIETMPFSETRQYVHKVIENMCMYEVVMRERVLSDQLPRHLN